MAGNSGVYRLRIKLMQFRGFNCPEGIKQKGSHVMRKRGLLKRVISCMLMAGIGLSITACGNDYGNHEKGVANTDASQTDFSIMGGMGALSVSYDKKPILNQLQEEAGDRKSVV